jgi:dTDP-4-dehydrorhamnose 3,5-epimerase
MGRTIHRPHPGSESVLMIFTKTNLEGAWIIDIDKLEDERGFFARTFCQREFHEHGLNPCVAQCNVSYNKKKGTFRGMHLQVNPYQEAKLVQCMAGAIYDVIVDLRPESSTYKQHLGITLSARSYRMLYIPEGLAHGFLTLEDDTNVFYQMSEFYAPESARGFRWNDPAFEIVLPGNVNVISERDANYSDFSLDLLR